MRRRGNWVDFVVVGSGSGGLAAAIAAADAGLDVAVYEKARLVGGGTAYSGGSVWAPCNHIMRRKGIHDTPEDALQYLDRAAGGRGDPAIARAYVDTVGGLIERVEEWTGIKWIIWPGSTDAYTDLPGSLLSGRSILQHPNSAHEVLAPAEERLPALKLVRPTPHMDFVPGFQGGDRPAREAWLGGRAIIGGLFMALLERGIPYHVSTGVSELIVDEGHVVGVTVKDAEGGESDVHARKGVLLNTGGFDWNRDFVRRYLPIEWVYPQTPPSNTGDGHRLGMSVGAATSLMDKAIWHPAIRIPGDTHEGEPLYRMFNAELAKPHCIVVNRAGRRFAPESRHAAVSEAMMRIDPATRAYPNDPAFFVADGRYRGKYGLPGVRDGEPLPAWISSAATLDELAGALGIDEQGLREEVEAFNRDAVTGLDPRFDRGRSAYDRHWGDPEHAPNPTMGALEEPPFCGFQIHLSHAGARGGLVTTDAGQVVRADGDVVQGLYACGNTAANVLFGSGYGSGSTVGSSLVFGYRAATHAAGT